MPSKASFLCILRLVDHLYELVGFVVVVLPTYQV